MAFEHRNATPSGVKIGYKELYSFLPVTASGVTPAQAAVFADYIKAFRETFPYQLDPIKKNQLDYTTRSHHLNHTPADPAMAADWDAGNTIQKYMGASMPPIDWDEIGSMAMIRLLQTLHDLEDTFRAAA